MSRNSSIAFSLKPGLPSLGLFYRSSIASALALSLQPGLFSVGLFSRSSIAPCSHCLSCLVSYPCQTLTCTRPKRESGTWYRYQRRSDRVDLCSLRSLTRVPSTGVLRTVPAKVWGLSGRELPHIRLLMLPRDLLSKSARL